MKSTLYISCLCLNTLLAQDIPQINQPGMEKMMQKIQEIQVCMSKVDLNALSALESEAIQVQKQVETMCTQGKRDQAQKTALIFYTKVTSIPAMIQIKKCTQGLVSETNLKDKGHVCNGEKIEFGVPSNKRINW